MKVFDLLQHNQKEFLIAAYKAPQLYPITHDQEVLFDTFTLFATIFPEGTLADLLDFMAASCESPTARQQAFVQLAEKREHSLRVRRAKELATMPAMPPAVMQQAILESTLLAEAAVPAPSAVLLGDIVTFTTDQAGNAISLEVTKPTGEKVVHAAPIPTPVKPSVPNPFANLSQKR